MLLWFVRCASKGGHEDTIKHNAKFKYLEACISRLGHQEPSRVGATALQREPTRKPHSGTRGHLANHKSAIFAGRVQGGGGGGWGRLSRQPTPGDGEAHRMGPLS